jgi:NitT/TauT family transport system substrate-binding protein
MPKRARAGDLRATAPALPLHPARQTSQGRSPLVRKLAVHGLLAFALLAAFGVAVAPRSASSEPLKIIYSDWPGWVPWEIAIQKKWDKEAGLDLQFLWMDYVAGMDAFAAGQADGVSVTNGDALVMGAKSGKPSTAIIINDYSNGNDMVIGGPGIDSLQDLKGKKMGVEVGFVSHLLLLKALESAGMKESDVTLVNIPTNETPNALASGAVDAITAWQPSTGQALKIVPGAKRLYTSADTPGLIYDILYVSQESLAARKDEWAKVVKLWYRVVDYLKDPRNQSDALKILAARVQLTPAEYEPFLAGTYILTLDEALAVWNGGKEAGLKSLAGSDAVVDEFNVKYKIYEKPEAKPSYHDASLTKALKP